MATYSVYLKISNIMWASTNIQAGERIDECHDVCVPGAVSPDRKLVLNSWFNRVISTADLVLNWTTMSYLPTVRFNY